jgi:multiple sugar transport system permease protein
VKLRRFNKSTALNGIGILVAAIFLFPVYWMLATSVKNREEIFHTPPTILPRGLDWSSYTEQFNAQIGGHFLNSVIISVLAMAIVVALSIPSAYGLARYRIRGAKLVILFLLITQMLPTTLILTPMFIMFKQAAILNTYLAPILANATLGIPFSVLMMRPYFLGAPKELEDAACIDGCTPFTAFLRIMVPISSPGIIVSAIFSFLFAWGDLIFSITFVRNQNLWPITAAIYNSVGQYGLEWNSVMAFAAIVVLPVIALFIFLQRYLVAGLTSGAIK